MDYRIVFVVLAVSLLVGGCVSQNVEVNITGNQSANLTSPPSGPFDCGASMNCLIEKSNSCALSKATVSQPVNFFGAIINTTSYFQINGTDQGKCLFYIKTLNISLRYDDQTVQQLLKSGVTMAQIRETEKNASENAEKSGVLMDDVCRFEQKDLTNLLTRWAVGNFSSNDYKNAECTGKVFGTTAKQNCTKNSDCGANELCNMATGECLKYIVVNETG